MTDEVTSTEEGVALPDESQIEQTEPETVEPEQGKEPEGGPERSEEKPDEPKKPKGFMKRIQKLEQQRDHYKQLAEQAGKSEPKPPEPAKTLKDFNYDEAQYADYVMNRALETAKAESRTAAHEALNEVRKQQLTESTMNEFRAREAEFAKSHPDYQQVAWTAPISDEVAEIIASMDEGPEVLFELGKNPEYARALSSISPTRAAMELGRFAVELEQMRSVVKPVSKAPEPPPKIGGKDPGNIERDPSKMSDAEFTKWFRKHIRKQ